MTGEAPAGKDRQYVTALARGQGIPRCFTRISQLSDDAKLREEGLELQRFAARLAPALIAPR